MRMQFTLRRLLIGVAIVAVVCAGWPTVRQALVSQKLQGIGATIQFDDDTKPWFDRPPKGFADHIDADITEIVWDENLQNGNTKLIDDESFRTICTFSKVWNITLDDCGLTDQSIGEIAKLPFLSVLRLRKSQIGDGGVAAIVQNKRIENLVLSNSLVTDACAAHFMSLPKLYYLDLSGTMITDQSVSELARNEGLTFLNIQGTGVTASGLAQLKAALPVCKIHY
jgi:hypothetical protein